MALDGVDDCWDENGRGDLARVAAAFTCLRANKVDAYVECLLDVFGVTDHLGRKHIGGGKIEAEGGRKRDAHVHDYNTGFVKPLDDFTWRDADSGYEETRLLFDDDVNELGQLAMSVINLKKRSTFIHSRVSE